MTELHLQSVLTDVGKLNLEDACHGAAIPAAFSPAGGAAGVSAAWLTQHGDANYALASPAGGVAVVTLPAQGAACAPPDGRRLGVCVRVCDFGCRRVSTCAQARPSPRS